MSGDRSITYRDIEYELNRLALLWTNNNPTLAAQAAANVWAGTDSTRDMLGALNFKAWHHQPKGLPWTECRL